VPEAVPVLDVGSTKRTDELLSDEHAEGRVDRLLPDELEYRPPRELLPDDRGTVDHLALALLQLAEPSCEERVDRGRDGDLLWLAVNKVLGQHREHLGDEERVPVRRRGDPGTEPVVELDLEGGVGDQLLALTGAQRLEGDRDGVRDGGVPIRANLERLRPRQAEGEHRRARQLA